MHRIVLLLVLQSALLTLAKPTAQSNSMCCPPGRKVIIKCPVCVCSDSGKRISCTFDKCPTTPKPEPQPECEEGDTKKNDCNICKCVKSKWTCTKIWCITELTPDKQQCREGDRLMKECSECVCNKDNELICNPKPCSTPKLEDPCKGMGRKDETYKPPCSERQPKHRPKQQPKTTEKPCDPPQAAEPQDPCGGAGTKKVSTVPPCPEQQPKEDPCLNQNHKKPAIEDMSKSECREGDRKMQGCNMCICNGQREFVCETKPCTPAKMSSSKPMSKLDDLLKNVYNAKGSGTPSTETDGSDGITTTLKPSTTCPPYCYHRIAVPPCCCVML